MRFKDIGRGRYDFLCMVDNFYCFYSVLFYFGRDKKVIGIACGGLHNAVWTEMVGQSDLFKF